MTITKHTKKFLVTILVVGFVFIPSLALALSLSDPLVQCGDVPSKPCGFKELIELINRIIDWLILITVPIATLLFAWAGGLYLTSGGNSGQVEKATTIFKNVFWGIIITLAAFLIVKLIVNTLLEPGYVELSMLSTYIL